MLSQKTTNAQCNNSWCERSAAQTELRLTPPGAAYWTDSATPGEENPGLARNNPMTLPTICARLHQAQDRTHHQLPCSRRQQERRKRRRKHQPRQLAPRGQSHRPRQNERTGRPDPAEPRLDSLCCCRHRHPYVAKEHQLNQQPSARAKQTGHYHTRHRQRQIWIAAAKPGKKTPTARTPTPHRQPAVDPALALPLDDPQARPHADCFLPPPATNPGGKDLHRGPQRHLDPEGLH